MRNKVLVIDTELSCFDDKLLSEGLRPFEIFQFGMAIVDLNTLTIGQVGSYYVLNDRHVVSRFCTELTGITQNNLSKSGLPLGHVAELLRTRWGSYAKNTQVVSWGCESEYMKPDFKVKCVDYPFRDSILDLSSYLKFGNSDLWGMSLSSAASRYDVDVCEPLHNAEADAVTTARLLISMIRRGDIWPWLNRGQKK